MEGGVTEEQYEQLGRREGRLPVNKQTRETASGRGDHLTNEVSAYKQTLTDKTNTTLSNH